jgi:hypothetical protein
MNGTNLKEENGISDEDLRFQRQLRNSLMVTLIGFLILILGAKPSLFGLDRSPVIGFVQTATFIVGLGIICLGGKLSLNGFWKGKKISLTADFGLRIIATGYVIAVFTAMADVFGFGSHPLPGVPFFGPLQSRGVIIGEAIIAVGLVMVFSPVDDSPDADEKDQPKNGKINFQNGK